VTELYRQADLRHWINGLADGIEAVAFGAAFVSWLIHRRRFLRRALIVANLVLTSELVVSVVLLIVTLNQFGPDQAPWLLHDTFLVLVVNILISAVWYWLLAAPHHRESANPAPPDFLFPQHAALIQGHAGWRANFLDYLFLAAMTTTTLGPAETIPLSRRAKLLMLLQVTISLFTLTALAGRALSILTD